MCTQRMQFHELAALTSKSTPLGAHSIHAWFCVRVVCMSKQPVHVALKQISHLGLAHALPFICIPKKTHTHVHVALKQISHLGLAHALPLICIPKKTHTHVHVVLKQSHLGLAHALPLVCMPWSSLVLTWCGSERMPLLHASQCFANMSHLSGSERMLLLHANQRLASVCCSVLLGVNEGGCVAQCSCVVVAQCCSVSIRMPFQHVMQQLAIMCCSNVLIIIKQFLLRTQE